MTATSANFSTRCSAAPPERGRAVEHARKCAAQINTPRSQSTWPMRTTVRHARLLCAKPASMNPAMSSAPSAYSTCGYRRASRKVKAFACVARAVLGFNGGPAGDLYLEVEFEPDPRYRVEGRDVTQTVPVAPWEAALGATIEVPTPRGRVEVNVPAGSNNGRKLRLKGRGIPGNPPGDLYLELELALPPANNEKAREVYQTMAREFSSFNPREQMGAQR